MLSPEQYGDLRQSLGEIKALQLSTNEKLDTHVERLNDHSKRIRSLEGSRKWATGIVGLALLFRSKLGF